MSSKAKGDRAENRFGDLLHRMGYLVHVTIPAPARRKPGGGWYSTGNNDIFTIFDVVAKGNGKTVWVQVTYPSSISARRTKMRALMSFFNPEFDEVFIASWHTPPRPGQRGHFELYRLEDDFLKGPGDGWEVRLGDRALPWHEDHTPTKQVKLK